MTIFYKNYMKEQLVSDKLRISTFRHLFDPPLVRVADEFFVSFPTVRSGEELCVRVCLCLYSGVSREIS